MERIFTDKEWQIARQQADIAIERIMTQPEPTVGHNAAFPVSEEDFYAPGLTKREYFACQILNGLIADCGGTEAIWQNEIILKNAVALADALIKELNK